MRLAASILPLLAACVALPACSRAPLSAPSKEEPAVTTAPPSATATQPPQAGAVLRRVLDLIQGSHALADLTPARVEQTMGIRLERARDGSARYGVGAALDPPWSYTIELDATAPDAAKFAFNFTPASADAAMTPVCQLDYDAFGQRLEALGFTRTPYNAEHGRLVKEWFDKPGLRVSVYPQGESDGAAEHRCVRTVTIQ